LAGDGEALRRGARRAGGRRGAPPARCPRQAPEGHDPLLVRRRVAVPPRHPQGATREARIPPRGDPARGRARERARPAPPRLTRPGADPYPRRVLGKCAAAYTSLLLLLTASAASAEHETYYRFTVLGYVKDAAGKRGAGIPVELIREKTGFSYLGETDSSG